MKYTKKFNAFIVYQKRTYLSLKTKDKSENLWIILNRLKVVL